MKDILIPLVVVAAVIWWTQTKGHAAEAKAPPPPPAKHQSASAPRGRPFEAPETDPPASNYTSVLQL